MIKDNELKIVIADDDPDVLKTTCEMVRCILEGSGRKLNIRPATDGLDALASIAQHDPDLVITDYKMPGYDGATVVEKARKGLDYQKGVIILSGDAEEVRTKVRSMDCNHISVLAKPVDLNKLKKTIEQYL